MENSSKGADHLSILVVEDKPDLGRMLCDFLEAEGHAVIAARKLQDALAEASRRYFDLALIGLRPGTQSGMDLTLLRAKSPWIKLVVCAAQSSTESVIEAMNYGAFDYLTKPFTRDRIVHLIRRVAEIRTVEQKLSALKQIYEESVPEVMLESSNSAMQRVLTMARQVADSEASILIRGESGTGKNVLAREIHSWSSRSPKPFATISCPYLPAELLESELFGHTKGSICRRHARLSRPYFSLSGRHAASGRNRRIAFISSAKIAAIPSGKNLRACRGPCRQEGECEDDRHNECGP